MLRLLFILPLFIFSTDKTAPLKLAYKIDEKSQLFLLGATNVNTFKCSCTDKFSPAYLEAEINESTKLILFKNTTLGIKTTLLNCNNNVMNRDMHKALKADKYPYIYVQLLQATPLQPDKELQTGKAYTYQVNTIITIAGISKAHVFHVKFMKHSNHLLRMNASKEILMSDYEIRPRTPFNIIKIDDRITIHFHLLLIVGS